MDLYLDGLLNFPNITIEKCIISESKTELTLKFLNHSIICPHCSNKIDEIHQERAISVRDLSIFGKLTILNLNRRQFYCESCHKFTTEKLDYIDFDRHTTLRYQNYIYERVRVSTVTQVAKEESLTYDRVQSIFMQVNKKKRKMGPVQNVSA
jgi:transposase